MASSKAPETKPATAPENKNGTNGPPAPDYDLAAKIIRESIDGTAERRAKMNGDLSASWKRVEDEAHVNKAAAKDARKVARMSDETQSGYLRSFFGLMGPLGIGVRRDLVDLAEGVGGLMIPLKDAPASELEGDAASAATKAMKETAAADKAKREAAAREAAKAKPPTHPADDSDLADAGEAARRDALAGAALDKMAKG